MIISLALSLIAIASGTLLTYTYDEGAPLVSRLGSGACIGFAAMGLLGFLIALVFGLSGAAIGLTAALLLLPVLLLISEKTRKQIDDDISRALKAISRASTRPDRWAFIYFLFYAGVAIVMWLVFDRALLEKPEGIYTGVLNNYGDLPFHLSVITRFAYGQNYPPEDPTFAGVRFTYPFLTDFISAMFVRAGASLRNALFIENWIIGVALLGVVHRFGQRLVRNRTAAMLTPLLILLNGGFGWSLLWGDVSKVEGGVFQVLRHLQHSYTILPEIEKAWRWGNSITSLLVTQRGFLLCIPLAAIVFTQWWAAMTDTETRGHGDSRQKSLRKEKGSENDLRVAASPRLRVSARRMIAAGIIAGLLPLIHAHSFIAVLLVAAFLVPWLYPRAWIAYGIAALVALIIFFGAANYQSITSLPIKIAFVVLLLGLLINLYFILPRLHLRLWVCFFLAGILVGL